VEITKRATILSVVISTEYLVVTFISVVFQRLPIVKIIHLERTKLCTLLTTYRSLWKQITIEFKKAFFRCSD